jgi:hypothetical protein
MVRHNYILLHPCQSHTPNHCPRQFAWRLHSTVVILAQLVTVWFMQRIGKAGIHQSNNTLWGAVRSSVTPAHGSYCADNGEILFWTVLLSRACAERVILSTLPSTRTQDKWRGQYSKPISVSIDDYVTDITEEFHVLSGVDAIIRFPWLRHQHEARLSSSNHRRRPILRLEEDNLPLWLSRR